MEQQQREENQTQNYISEKLIIHHAFSPISKHIIQDKLFYSYSEKVRNPKWCESGKRRGKQ